tara:strand:- start:494 stop:886 length:393 start_codon:yes stop_codon:yes gene_type:complete
MGNQQSLSFCNCQELQDKISNVSKVEPFLLISTLDKEYQHCLIQGTLSIDDEETQINEYIRCKKKANVIVYGKNYRDETVYKKFKQLCQFGLFKVKMYGGGIFEWLLLQEIYGKQLFPTQGEENDILKYK